MSKYFSSKVSLPTPYLLKLPLLLLPPDDLLEVVPPELQQLVHVQAEVHATRARSGDQHTDAENNGMQFSDNETMNSNTHQYPLSTKSAHD